MEKYKIKFGINIPLSLHKATVIHADKFTESLGGAFNFPITSTLYIDLVFRLDETNEDWPVYITNLNLPVYTGQAVTVVSTDKTVLGYIDAQTNYYYYTTNDFVRKLNIGIPFIWVWIIGITGGILIYLLKQEVSVWIIVPLISAWILYSIQKFILNILIKKRIDNFLT